MKKTLNSAITMRRKYFRSQQDKSKLIQDKREPILTREREYLQEEDKNTKTSNFMHIKLVINSRRSNTLMSLKIRSKGQRGKLSPGNGSMSIWMSLGSSICSTTVASPSATSVPSSWSPSKNQQKSMRSSESSPTSFRTRRSISQSPTSLFYSW